MYIRCVFYGKELRRGRYKKTKAVDRPLNKACMFLHRGGQVQMERRQCSSTSTFYSIKCSLSSNGSADELKSASNVVL